MKRIILSVLLTLSIVMSYGIEYRSVGSNANFCVYTFDGNYFLILSFKDDDENRLSDLTIIKFMLKDGTIMRLEGFDGSRKTSASSYYWGFGYASSSSNDRHFAIVTITPEQIEQLKVGVDKVAINTIPEAYKRSKWAGKEKFGPSLYEDFKNLKNEFDE